MTKTDAEIYDVLMAAGVKRGMLVLMSNEEIGYVVSQSYVSIDIAWGGHIAGFYRGQSRNREVLPVRLQEINLDNDNDNNFINRLAAITIPYPAPLSGKTCKLEVDGVTYTAKLEVG